MCIAIHVPIGSTLTDDEFKNCWKNNSDGFGLMYVRKDKETEEDKIQIYKSMKKVDRCLEKYREHEINAMENESDMVLHFRIASSGLVNIKNCHPFKVSDNLAFCHNGVLFSSKGDRSDTRIYNETIIQRLPEDWFENEAIVYLMADSIGHNKFVFLTIDKRVFIINKELGKVDKERGIWFSNESYKKRVVKTRKSTFIGESDVKYSDKEKLFVTGYGKNRQFYDKNGEEWTKVDVEYLKSSSWCDLCKESVYSEIYEKGNKSYCSKHFILCYSSNGVPKKKEGDDYQELFSDQIENQKEDNINNTITAKKVIPLEVLMEDTIIEDLELYYVLAEIYGYLFDVEWNEFNFNDDKDLSCNLCGKKSGLYLVSEDLVVCADHFKIRRADNSIISTEQFLTEDMDDLIEEDKEEVFETLEVKEYNKDLDEEETFTNQETKESAVA